MNEVEQERQTVFWQRVYLQTLQQLVADQLAACNALLPKSLARQAGEHASEAVKQLAEFQETQPQDPPEAGADAGDSPADDSHDQYLGG